MVRECCYVNDSIHEACECGCYAFVPCTHKEIPGIVIFVSTIESRFKIQFNSLEISQLFYEKVMQASGNDFMDLVNKRVWIGILVNLKLLLQATLPKPDEPAVQLANLVSYS